MAFVKIYLCFLKKHQGIKKFYGFFLAYIEAKFTIYIILSAI